MIWFWIVAIASSVWIYWDAGAHHIGKVAGAPGKNYSAGGWASFAIFFPFVGLILYWRARPQLIELGKQHPITTSRLKRVLFAVAMGLLMICLIGLASSRSTPATKPAESSTQSTNPREDNYVPEPVAPTPEASAPVAGPVDLTQLPWDKNNENGIENGNLDIAFQNVATIQDPKNPVYQSTIENMLRAPWENYGKVICAWATITDATDYPPGSDASKRFNNAKVGEWVGYDEKGKYVSMFVIGGSGGGKIGFSTRFCGLVTGRADDDQGNTRLIMLGVTSDYKP